MVERNGLQVLLVRGKGQDAQSPNGILELALSVDEATALASRTEGWIAIAGALPISIKTVRTHVSNIFGELQVADRAQAVIRAREAGLG